MNMYALLYVGIFLEPLLGRIRFTVAYLATGVAASLISLWWHDNTISAGASGAIFGMYGVFLFMLLTNIIAKDVRKSMLQSIGIFIGYNLLFGLKAGVDNAAHIGGLVSGFAIGAILYISVRQPENKRIEKLISGAVLVTVVLAAWILIPRVNDPVGDYIKIMDEFVKQENEAMAVFRVPDNTNTDTYLELIEKKSMPAWKKCREQIEKAKQLKLPPELSKRVNLIDEYVSHRIKETELRQKALREETDQYNEDINNEVKKIEELIKELTGF
jgi:rhomboid protease GluP